MTDTEQKTDALMGTKNSAGKTDKAAAKHGVTVKFPVYMNDRLMNADITELELTQRSYNCLRRAGYATVGDIVNSITRPEDLSHIRNLGKKSQDEIVRKIFIFQVNNMTPEKKEAYFNKVEEMNITV